MAQRWSAFFTVRFVPTERVSLAPRASGRRAAPAGPPSPRPMTAKLLRYWYQAAWPSWISWSASQVFSQLPAETLVARLSASPLSQMDSQCGMPQRNAPWGPHMSSGTRPWPTARFLPEISAYKKV